MILLALTLAWAGIAQAAQAGASAEAAVVQGKLKNLDFEAMDEWGMNVRATARLRVQRVVSGKVRSRVLKIHYITHSGLPENRTVRLRLRPSEDGSYLVCSEGGRGYICD